LTETKTENKIGVFVRNQSIVVPIAAIFVAFVLGGILIFLQGVNPLVAYRAIFSEAWFDSDGLLRTFQKTTPLVLAGLAVTVGLRVGLFSWHLHYKFTSNFARYSCIILWSNCWSPLGRNCWCIKSL
jgi:hypothetical protein